MKKIVILACAIFVLVGCTKTNDADVTNLINNAITSRVTTVNTLKKGYSYYLPTGLSVIGSADNNEILKDSKYKYYLFVDLISYHNKIEFKYQDNNTSYKSMIIENEDKYGYLEINKIKEEKYLIEIMYNYAKIEVMVDYDDINTSVAYAMSVLSSITYNDSVIVNLIGNDILNFKEEEFNIFKTVSSDSNYLKYEEDYKYIEEDIPDLDLVN